MKKDWTKTAIRFAAALGIVLAGLAPAAAQTTSGGVTGTVRDEQGAAIPTAAVTLTSDTRGTVLVAGINHTGDFVFATVPPDTYTLAAKADGFKAVERRTWWCTPTTGSPWASSPSAWEASRRRSA